MSETAAENIKAFWQTRAGSADLAEQQVTHHDVWQRWLEIEMLKRFVTPDDRVLDVGCGNGYTTKRLAPHVREIVGADYAEGMIQRARAEEYPDGASEKISFAVADALTLTPETFGLFDVVITERCLINLTSWEAQQRVLANLAAVLKPGGRLLFVEGCQQGRAGLNEMRQKVGLAQMPNVWHNLDFDRAATLAYLDRFFALERDLHFGVYDFVARVVHPLAVAPAEPAYDSPLNQVGARLALESQEFGALSRVLFLVLKKK